MAATAKKKVATATTLSCHLAPLQPILAPRQHGSDLRVRGPSGSPSRGCALVGPSPLAAGCEQLEDRWDPVRYYALCHLHYSPLSILHIEAGPHCMKQTECIEGPEALANLERLASAILQSKWKKKKQARKPLLWGTVKICGDQYAQYGVVPPGAVVPSIDVKTFRP
jgi:hypothetical protein